MNDDEKIKIAKLMGENRAKPIGEECICPWCKTVFVKKRGIQYAHNEKCGYRLRDNIGSFKKADNRRKPASKPVNRHPIVEQWHWPAVARG